VDRGLPLSTCILLDSLKRPFERNHDGMLDSIEPDRVYFKRLGRVGIPITYPGIQATVPGPSFLRFHNTPFLTLLTVVPRNASIPP
jgi:hypothetical protein